MRIVLLADANQEITMQRHKKLESWRYICLMGLCCFLLGCAGQSPSGYMPGKVLYLDNGVIRVGADLNYGGSITYLSLSDQDRNLINNHDRGRQVQQSYYAGESLDRRDEGQSEDWSPWPWNPIGAGDAYGNLPQVVDASNDGSIIYAKTIPLLWDMNNESAECYFETWIALEENTVHIWNRLITIRTDAKWKVVSMHQELPAVYTIGDLYNLYTYDGSAPFTDAPLIQIQNSGPPWAYWGANAGHEKWAALVDDTGWGVGVYNPTTEVFVGGFSGSPGGGTDDTSTGYIAPLRTELLDKDTIYEYECYLIVGTLAEIREFAYQKEGLL